MVIKSIFFHKPSMMSTHDTPESIAPLPPESDLDDDQIRNMLALPLYLQEREASADRSLVYHSFRESSVSSSSHFRGNAGKPAALFSHTRNSSQDTFSDRDGISSRHQTVEGKGETFVTFSNPEETVRLALEQQKRSSTRRSEIWNLEARM